MKARILAIVVLLLAAGAAGAAAQGEPAATPSPSQAPADLGAGVRRVVLICPVCNTGTEGFELDTFQSSGVDTDFCYIGASQSYYERLIATCPKCGYTGYNDDFQPTLKELPEKVAETVRAKLPKYFPDKGLKPWERYASMALVYIWRGMSDNEIGNVYLRATYTMRDAPSDARMKRRERELRTDAIRYLEDATRSAHIGFADLPQAKYLIGELQRRNGRFDDALKNFEDVMKLKYRPDWLDKLLERQMEKARARDDS